MKLNQLAKTSSILGAICLLIALVVIGFLLLLDTSFGPSGFGGG